MRAFPATMMRSESPAAYDPRLDHDVDFHADRSLLSRAHNAPVRGVAPGSAGPGRAIASGTTGGARWRQREAIAFARLGILEFVATYMFALLSVGVVVSTAVARNRLSDAELTGSRLVAIALCSSLCFAALHWAFNLYAADMQQQAGPPHRLVASKLAMPAAASSGHRMTGDSSLQGMALGMAGSGSGAGLGTREPAIVTLLGSAPIAHMNPAVTLALLAATGMHYVVAIIFLVAQVRGDFFVQTHLHYTPSSTEQYCSSSPNAQVIFFLSFDFYFCRYSPPFSQQQRCGQPHRLNLPSMSLGCLPHRKAPGGRTFSVSLFSRFLRLPAL